MYDEDKLNRAGEKSLPKIFYWYAIPLFITYRLACRHTCNKLFFRVTQSLGKNLFHQNKPLVLRTSTTGAKQIHYP